LKEIPKTGGRASFGRKKARQGGKGGSLATEGGGGLILRKKRKTAAKRGRRKRGNGPSQKKGSFPILEGGFYSGCPLCFLPFLSAKQRKDQQGKGSR